MAGEVPGRIEMPGAPDIPGLVFRGYRGEEDLPHFVEVHAGCKEADGIWWTHGLEDFRNEYSHLQNCDPARDIVVTEVDGRVVGFMKFYWMPQQEGRITYRQWDFLLPEWRGKGIRSALYDYVEARARELMADHGNEGDRWLTTEVTEREASKRQLLEAMGYEAVRYFHIMVRDLSEPIHELPLPEGIEVRPVEDLRKAFFAASEALLDHWGSRQFNEEDFQHFTGFSTFDPDLWVIAYDGDEVAGTVMNWINEEENLEFSRKWGYTEIITVRRPYRGRGLAKALVSRSMKLLRDLGMETASLEADSENLSGAIGLYTGLGYKVDRTYAYFRKDLEE